MYVIVLASQKGGVGKTTLAINLAVAAVDHGNTCLLDADPQGSLTIWHKRRDKEAPVLFDLGDKGIEAVPQAIEVMANNDIEYCFIDTRPSVTIEIAKLISLANLVLIPTRPALPDVLAALPTAELAKAEGKKVMFVVNSSKSLRLATEAMSALSKEAPVASLVGDRLAFVDCYAKGLSVTEYERNGKASEDIRKLLNDVQEALA